MFAAALEHAGCLEGSSSVSSADSNSPPPVAGRNTPPESASCLVFQINTFCGTLGPPTRSPWGKETVQDGAEPGPRPEPRRYLAPACVFFRKRQPLRMHRRGILSARVTVCSHEVVASGHLFPVPFLSRVQRPRSVIVSQE